MVAIGGACSFEETGRHLESSTTSVFEGESVNSGNSSDGSDLAFDDSSSSNESTDGDNSSEKNDNSDINSSEEEQK